MGEVLLFVCSKMAYETNLSSEWPVGDRLNKRDLNFFGDALALAFR